MEEKMLYNLCTPLRKICEVFFKVLKISFQKENKIKFSFEYLLSVRKNVVIRQTPENGSWNSHLYFPPWHLRSFIFQMRNFDLFMSDFLSSP